MNSFTLEIWDDEGALCSFYTVKWDNSEISETDKFFKRFYANENIRTCLQQLLSFILDSIGNDYGAIDSLFNRHENEVVGLPNRGNVAIGELTFMFPDFPLRLYALRLSRNLVILFNGGLKSARTNQESKDLNLKWIEACQFAKRIEKALMDGDIIILDRYIISVDNDDEIIL